VCVCVCVCVCVNLASPQHTRKGGWGQPYLLCVMVVFSYSFFYLIDFFFYNSAFFTDFPNQYRQNAVKVVYYRGTEGTSPGYRESTIPQVVYGNRTLTSRLSPGCWGMLGRGKKQSLQYTRVLERVLVLVLYI
jgi:hypothetical protein